MKNESQIILKDIAKTYGEKIVFKNFEINIPKEKTTILMGNSGRGKTTLLNIIMGLELPDSGSIYGKENMRLSAVFQEDRLCELLSVEANIKLVLNSKVRHESVLENLKLVGLEKELRTPVKKLSGGMKRRVAIVRAVMAESDIILMDEPFKGLDIETRRMCMEYVKKYTYGKTLIISTHSHEEADFMGDLIIKI